jgi:hypothetical protein
VGVWARARRAGPVGRAGRFYRGEGPCVSGCFLLLPFANRVAGERGGGPRSLAVGRFVARLERPLLTRIRRCEPAASTRGFAKKKRKGKKAACCKGVWPPDFYGWFLVFAKAKVDVKVQRNTSFGENVPVILDFWKQKQKQKS